jgi:hypothetical protein
VWLSLMFVALIANVGIMHWRPGRGDAPLAVS